MRDFQAPRVYDYAIDEHGDWYCEGNPVTDRGLFQRLSRSLIEQDGRYFIRCEGEVHPVRVADAPLWVRHVHLKTDDHGRLIRVDLELQDGRCEPLKAETLTQVNQQALYCLATSRRLRARFGKTAYYELTRHLRMDEPGEFFYFLINGRRYELRDSS